MIGGGYVGLVTAACLAELGHLTTCVESEPSRFSVLSKGGIPIYEIGLKDLIKKNRRQSRINFSNRHHDLQNVEVIFLAVGTPPLEDGSADTTQLFKAVCDVLEATAQEIIFIVKSTVPVGTNRQLEAFTKENF